LRLSRAIVLAVAMCPALGPEAEAQSSPVEFRFETADGELLRRLASENAVDTTVARRGVQGYLEYLLHRLALWFLDLLRPLGQYAQGAGKALGGTVVVFAASTAVLLLFVGLRYIVRRRRSAAAPDPSSSAIAGPEPESTARDAARWRQELQRRIDESDVAGSLEAVWWWLARSLQGTRVQESWTSGELLACSNRAGLREPLRRLERMMYGTSRPSLEEVLDVVRSLERQLA
jgi:hypothetical protein